MLVRTSQGKVLKIAATEKSQVVVFNTYLLAIGRRFCQGGHLSFETDRGFYCQNNRNIDFSSFSCFFL